MTELQVGLNRWDWRSPASFASQVAEAERAGISWAFLPVNALGVPDPYVLMAAGAASTTTMGFGPLLETPRLRPPAVAAGSIATVDAVADGRTMLTYGIGDTAVRWLGDRPATVAELENAVSSARTLLAGEGLDLGAERPALLRHHRPVPVWIAAAGPRTLRMAGRVADGVFIRAGRHPGILTAAIDHVRAGAAEAGRNPAGVAIGLIVHTVFADDQSGLGPAGIRSINRAMAAGFHEYSPMLFEQAGLDWNGPPVHDLQELVYPDFHHANDLVAAGEVVSFLDEETAGWFSFHGSRADIDDQVAALRELVPELSILVPHPVPLPAGGRLLDYVHWWTGP